METVPPDGLVARQRLDLLLRRDVFGAPVTLVSAGAGSGKTTAVRMWLRGGGFAGTSAWVTIDKRDNWYPALRRKIFNALATDPPDRALVTKSNSLASGVRRIFRAGAPTLLVIDDVQELVEPTPLDELRELMERCPSPLRLVLISRSDPPLRLQRWRVDGRLAEIRAKHLAFRRPEVVDLFCQYGILLTESQLDVLLERTQGWAAGIRLAAMSLDPDAVDEGLARFAGDQRSVAEYLVGEVLDRLPERTQRLLLRLSVVDEVQAPLAEALTDDAKAMTVLQGLAEENELLFGFGADRSRVRFHPLLRQLLYHQLLARDPEAARELHRQAALWLSANDETVGALKQAIQSHDEPLIDTATTAAIPVLFTLDAPALASIVTEGDHGLPVIVRHVLHGDLAQASEMIGRSPDDGIALAMLDLMTVSMGRDTRITVGRATEVLRRLRKAPVDEISTVEHYRCAALAYLGVALLWSGQTLRAEAYLLEAARESKVHRQTVVRAMCLSHMAVLKATTGATRLAAQYARAALALEPSGPAQLGLAQTELLRGNLDQAAEHLDDLALTGDALCALAGRLISADILLLRGAVAQARDLLDDVAAEMGRTRVVAGLLDRWYATVLANVTGETVTELRLHQYEDAAKRLRPLLSEPEPLIAVEAWIGYALALHGSHHENAAGKAMAQALRLAERQKLLRPFAFFGEPARESLQRLAATDFGREVLDWLDELTVPHEVDERELTITAGLIEPLTERELIILRYLPTLRRNTEIGDSLFVTVNTVKAHLKAVYRKLGVTSRREAVEKARELHLL